MDPRPPRVREVLASVNLRSSERDLEGTATRIVAFLEEHDEALVDTSIFDPSTSTATVVAERPAPTGEDG